MGPNGRRRAMMTRCSPWLGCLAVLMSLLVIPAFPQMQTQTQEDGPLDSSLPDGITVRDIISRFAAQELTFKQAREHYTYRQVVRMQTISDTGFPDGEYDTTFDVTFNDQGERVVKQVSQPRD